MELSDDEISILQEVLTDEVLRNDDEPGRTDDTDQGVLNILLGRVWDEAKKRRLWWALRVPDRTGA